MKEFRNLSQCYTGFPFDRCVTVFGKELALVKPEQRSLFFPIEVGSCVCTFCLYSLLKHLLMLRDTCISAFVLHMRRDVSHLNVMDHVCRGRRDLQQRVRHVEYHMCKCISTKIHTDVETRVRTCGMDSVSASAWWCVFMLNTELFL